MWRCTSYKALGPDGINFYCYKKTWKVIKDDVFQLVDSFFHTGKLPSSIKSSFITLIIKKCPANQVDEFRPISVLSTIPKLITKILAERLRLHLDHLISPNQTAFINGRQSLKHSSALAKLSLSYIITTYPLYYSKLTSVKLLTQSHGNIS